MVYGPIAVLVEMFPTRIRYTSMSLPYHIGNGWFGGCCGGFAIGPDRKYVQRPVVPDHRGWHDFVIGMLFVKETKDVDITPTTELIRWTRTMGVRPFNKGLPVCEGLFFSVYQSESRELIMWKIA